MPPGKIIPIVIVMALLPLFAGMAVNRFLPHLARWLARPVSLAGMVLLLAALAAILVSMSGAIWAMLGSGVIVVLVMFTLIGLAVGHVLGGPDPDDRAVLAVATCGRHPGIALAVAGLTFPDQKAAVAVVVLHLIVGAIASIPYRAWRRRALAGSAGNEINR